MPSSPQDSECYMILLNQIAPKGTNLDPVGSVVNVSVHGPVGG